jgi:NAD(P)H-dependent FMN reductase
VAEAPKILSFAGSTREQSFNKKLVKIAAAGAEKAGAKVTIVDLRDLPMPLYDGDLEEKSGLPENAKKLKDLMKSHQGFLISAPEYNSSITAVLKNAIDWASRPEPGEPSLAAFTGKTAAIMAASPGALGGLRGLVHVRAILGNINVLVIPDQVAVMKAHEAFGADGKLKDAKQQDAVERLGATLAGLLKKLNG